MSATPTTVLIHYSLVDYLPPTVIQRTHLYLLNLQEGGTKEDRIEVLEEEKSVIKFSDSTTTLLDLLYTFFSINKASPVGLGTFTDSFRYTIFFIHTHKSKVNNVYEALNILNKAQFRDKFFIQQFYESLPSEVIAYLSMGKDKPSHSEIFHRDSNHCLNIHQEFPALPSTKHKSKQTTKPRNNPSQPTKPKSKSTTTFANKAKYQSKQPSPPREPARQKYESSIAELQAENAALKHQVANLSAENTSLCSQVSHQDNNIQALNKSVEGIWLIFTMVIDAQPKATSRAKLSQQFEEYVAPQDETCHPRHINYCCQKSRVSIAPPRLRHAGGNRCILGQ